MNDWSEDLKKQYQTMIDAAKSNKKVEIKHGYKWKVITLKNVEHNDDENSYLGRSYGMIGSIIFTLTDINNTPYKLELREDSILETIREQYRYPPIFENQCNCGVAIVGGRHSAWCNFPNQYDIGNLERYKEEQIKKAKKE